MTFGTLRKPSQPFNTLQNTQLLSLAISKVQECKFSQVFARFRFIYFFVSCFLFLFFFIFINLFYSGTLRKPSTISELQKHELEMEIWGFVYFFIFLIFLFFVCFFFTYF